MPRTLPQPFVTTHRSARRFAFLERLATAIDRRPELAIDRMALLHQRLDLGDAAIELRVDASHDVLRQVGDLDIRHDAAVLGVPAVQRVPERELRLRRQAAVDQQLVTTDADYAAPRSLADHRRE